LCHIRVGRHAASLSSDFGQSFAVAVEQGQQGAFRREQLGGSRPIRDAAPLIRIRRPWRRAECVADIGLCRSRAISDRISLNI